MPETPYDGASNVSPIIATELLMHLNIVGQVPHDLHAANSYFQPGQDSISIDVELENGLGARDEDENQEIQKSKQEDSAKALFRGLDQRLPPLSDMPGIFEDLIKRGLGDVAGFFEGLQHIRGQGLRIATMCSGTESPIIALQLINEGKSLKLMHDVHCLT